jgi:ribonuclease J
MNNDENKTSAVNEGKEGLVAPGTFVDKETGTHASETHAKNSHDEFLNARKAHKENDGSGPKRHEPRGESGANNRGNQGGGQRRESGANGRQGGGRSFDASRSGGQNRGFSGGPNQRNQGGGQRGGNSAGNGQKPGGLKSNRGKAIMAIRRTQDDASKLVESFGVINPLDMKSSLGELQKGKLRVLFLGGQNAIGTHNLTVLEYEDDAIIVDCGFDLSVDLPGVNYGISDVSYLETIKNKIRGYVISHGHLDHIGGTPFVIPKYPAKVYGSQFTIGMIEKEFDEDFFHLDAPFKPETVAMNMDSHERLMLGKNFTIELIRCTHSIPDSSMIVIETPAGRILHTGDFRLDPEPLDHMPTDIERIKELANDSKGFLLLMIEGTNAQQPGRVKTESTLQQSFYDIFENTSGRIFVSSFSSNMNRVQMIINSAHKYGRKVAIAGRSMLSYMEVAVKYGYVKIPAGTIVPIRESVNLPDGQLVVVATGGQGELNSALQRMSAGEHPQYKLKAGDTVVVSSKPIPGNEVSYERIADDLTRMGVKIYSAKQPAVDGCGELHVSGHAQRDEMKELIEITKAKFIMPMYSGPRHRKYVAEIAVDTGVKGSNVFMVENGEAIEFDEAGDAKRTGVTPTGTVLIDETGMMVPTLVAARRNCCRGVNCR